jgi:hypothetical protein
VGRENGVCVEKFINVIQLSHFLKKMGGGVVFGKRKKKGPQYEYKTVKVSGTFKSGGGYSRAVQKEINKQAKKGWELDHLEELGRGRTRSLTLTSWIFDSTRYVMLVFKREKR